MKDEVIMEKPLDPQDNLRMLAELNGTFVRFPFGGIWPTLYSHVPFFSVRGHHWCNGDLARSRSPRLRDQVSALVPPMRVLH